MIGIKEWSLAEGRYTALLTIITAYVKRPENYIDNTPDVSVVNNVDGEIKHWTGMSECGLQTQNAYVKVCKSMVNKHWTQMWYTNTERVFQSV